MTTAKIMPKSRAEYILKREGLEGYNIRELSAMKNDRWIAMSPSVKRAIDTVISHKKGEI